MFQRRNRSGSSLELMQRLSDLYRELESPGTGCILLCPVLRETQRCSEETCLLCSPTWVGRRPGLLGTVVDSHPPRALGRAEHCAVTAHEGVGCVCLGEGPCYLQEQQCCLTQMFGETRGLLCCLSASCHIPPGSSSLLVKPTFTKVCKIQLLQGVLGQQPR